MDLQAAHFFPYAEHSTIFMALLSGLHAIDQHNHKNVALLADFFNAAIGGFKVGFKKVSRKGWYEIVVPPVITSPSAVTITSPSAVTPTFAQFRSKQVQLAVHPPILV